MNENAPVVAAIDRRVMSFVFVILCSRDAEEKQRGKRSEEEGCLFEERRGANNIWGCIDSNLRLSPVLKFKC